MHSEASAVAQRADGTGTLPPAVLVDAHGSQVPTTSFRATVSSVDAAGTFASAARAEANDQSAADAPIVADSTASDRPQGPEEAAAVAQLSELSATPLAERRCRHCEPGTAIWSSNSVIFLADWARRRTVCDGLVVCRVVLLSRTGDALRLSTALREPTLPLAHSRSYLGTSSGYSF